MRWGLNYAQEVVEDKLLLENMRSDPMVGNNDEIVNNTHYFNGGEDDVNNHE